jgi:hypothetical protein
MIFNQYSVKMILMSSVGRSETLICIAVWSYLPAMAERIPVSSAIPV